MARARGWAAAAVAAPVGALVGWLAALQPRAAAIAAAAAATGLLVLSGTQALLLALVGTQPWADLLAFPTPTATIPKIVGLLLVVSWLVQATTGRLRLRFVAPLGWALAFAAVVVLSMMVSPDPAAGVQKTVSYLLYAVFAAVFLQLVRGRAGVERILRVYAGSAAAAAAYGLFRFLAGQAGRASGPIADPNDFAFLLITALPMALHLAAASRRHRIAWAAASVLLLAATLATLSRGALVALLALVLWALLTRRISLPTAATAVGVAALTIVGALSLYGPLINERLVAKRYIADKNVASRQVFWSAAARMAADRPLTGVGPARFGAESGSYVLNDPIVLRNPVVHNTYLEILAENGVVALALFLALLASTWRHLGIARLRAAQAADPGGVRLTTALQASFVAAAVSALFVSEQLAIPFWLMAALAGSLVLADREAAAASRLPSPSSPPAPAAPASRPVS